MREYMVLWRDPNDYSWHYQDQGDSIRFYFAMPTKAKLLQGLNTSPFDHNFNVSELVIIWSQYFGFNTVKTSLDVHDANPLVDHSGAGRAPKG
jgi:hypothetical protein